MFVNRRTSSKIIFICLFFLKFNLSFAISSDVQQEKIEQSPKKSVIKERSKFVSFVFENDSIFDGSDDGYTNGVLVSYFDSSYRPSGIKKILRKYAPMIPFEDHTKVSFSIGQNMYTPEDIEISSNQKNDHPWAGFLYGTARAMTVTNDYIDDLELTVGIVGPASLTEQSQKIVHKAMKTRTPRGWDNQLKNEPGIILTWGRRKMNVLTTNIHPLTLTIEPNISVSVGNIYTLGEIGTTLRIMPITGLWVDTPLLIRPSMPGSSFFYSKNNSFNWYVFSGLQIRGIARNIFLDGNTFTDSASIKKRPIVADVNAGFAFAISNTRLSYTAVYRTREFYKQRYSSVFSNINISYSF